MGIQSIKILAVFGCSFFFSTLSFGQNPPFTIVTDIEKKCFYLGDTLSFTIKNLSSHFRGYTLEAYYVNGTTESQNFYSVYYTAYFNNDTSFFRKLGDKRKVIKEKSIKFIMPDVQIVPHSVGPDSLSTFLFVITGNKINKGVRLKFRITPDINDEEPDYLIETKPFLIFAKTM